MSNLAFDGFSEFINYLVFLKIKPNIVFVFVEDNHLTGIYQTLFQEIFPSFEIQIIPAITIADYVEKIPTGGKNTLKYIFDGLTANPQDNINFRMLFDPDFQLYFNIPPYIQDPRVFYLERYCLENYIIDLKIIVTTLKKFLPDKIDNEIENTIEIQFWLQSILEDLQSLFSYFAFNYHYSNSHNSSLVKKREMSMNSISNYFQKDSYVLDKSKIIVYYNLLISSRL